MSRWREAFDVAERAVGRRLESGVQTDAFAQALGVLGSVQADVRGFAERRMRRLWHALNLPAGSDISRLREQIRALDHEVRKLQVGLEHDRKERRSGR